MSSLSKTGMAGVAFILTWSVGSAPGFADDAVSRAELLASMCSTCHGTNGKGVKPNPGIAGEEAEDFIDTMKAFASGEEPTTIMNRHAQGYTEAELKLLADYFSRQ